MRPTKDPYFTSMAALVATRSTCLRRAVGCVLVDARGHVLSTGYNGVAAGQPHCNHEEQLPDHSIWHPHKCAAAGARSGMDLDGCQAIHAEQNALLQCHDVWSIETAYVTVTPCMTCMKLLLNTSCTRIVAAEVYTNRAPIELWLASGRELTIRAAMDDGDPANPLL